MSAADLRLADPGLQAAPTAGPGYLLGRTCRMTLDRPRIMGILNVTPDSFSDGGEIRSRDEAVARARQMTADGADLIDIGGESTRPGAAAVSLQEELDRVMPVLEALRHEIGIPVSIDTNKSEVAQAALGAGAEFINDISGLLFDARMAEVVARMEAGLFLMHTRGRPAQMQADTVYRDLIGEVIASLEESLGAALRAGVNAERVAIDPGIGFGKDAAGNLALLKRLAELGRLGRPILLGTSRKRFLGEITGQPEPRQRLAGTLATVALGVASGAGIFRVHDVGPARQAALTAWAICRAAA